MSINSALASVRRGNQRALLRKECERIINNFASTPTGSCRTVTQVVKRILLNGPYLLNGRMYDIKAKSLGAGVYELTAELRRTR